MHLGQRLLIRGLGPQRVVGFAEAPDDVGYPLAVPRAYVSRVALDSALGGQPDPQVNVAEIWLRDPRYLNEVLVQARTTSYGLRGLRIITRSGVRVLLDQAAGIVIDLLVALSLFALATAGVMLGASARAEVQRRLKNDRDQPRRRCRARALGRDAGTRGSLVAVPAATVGLLAGVLATIGATDRLLIMLNELPTGSGLILPLAAGWLTERCDPGARDRMASLARRRAATGRSPARRRPRFRPAPPAAAPRLASRGTGDARCPARRARAAAGSPRRC